MPAEEEIAISLELIRLQSKSDAPKQLASLDANLLERVSKTTMQAWPQVKRQNAHLLRVSAREGSPLEASGRARKTPARINLHPPMQRDKIKIVDM